MSRISGRIAGQGIEQELQQGKEEPVYVWRKELVVPEALSKPVGSTLGFAEQMGIVGSSTRSETPLRIRKWVRTEHTLQPQAKDHE